MDGDSGYCGTVLGTDIYTQNIRLVKEMLLKSACHTLDRDNLRAQKDTCGQGILEEDEEPQSAIWEDAVDALFKLNHWPYVNIETEHVRTCIEETFSDSLLNLSKEGGLTITAQAFTAFSTILMIYL